MVLLQKSDAKLWNHSQSKIYKYTDLQLVKAEFSEIQQSSANFSLALFAIVAYRHKKAP